MNNETKQILLSNNTQSQPSTSIQKLPDGTQAGLDNVLDFSKVCRTCATITELVIPIFGEEGLQNNFADKINKHLPIQVCSTDTLPVVVCYQCASTLLAWHELVTCCEQADGALRARLQQEQKPTNLKSDSSVEEETKSKFSIPEHKAQVPEPPAYRPETPQSQPGPRKRVCVYCAKSLEPAMYKEHLIVAHSEFLFHCEHCDRYIDKIDFMGHITIHAAHIMSEQEKKELKRRAAFRNAVKKKKQAPDVNQNITEFAPEAVIPKETDVEPAIQVNKSIKETEENEFSDHSDTEYAFGPLPESVFQAIEDTQDIQPLGDTNHTPDNENNLDCPDTPAENSNLSNVAPTPIETSNICNSTPPPENNNYSPRAENLIETSNLKTCAVLVSPLKPYELNTSQRVETNGSAEKSHKKSRTCPICAKVYTASSSYFYHMKYNHKNIKEHECPVCCRKFGTKACLTQHLTIHTGERQYECKECKKTFKSKASLYIHEQTHNGIKSWSCTQCHRSFRWKTHLLRHMKRHSAEKGHVCATCGRGFNVRCDLLRHARTHTSVNLNCDKCGQKFGQMRYLKVHMQKKHSINMVK